MVYYIVVQEWVYNYTKRGKLMKSLEDKIKDISEDITSLESERTKLRMSLVKIKTANERAIDILMKWNEITGMEDIHGSKLRELCSIIEDAVQIGIQCETGKIERLESEKEVIT